MVAQSFVGQLNKVAVLSDQEALAVLEAVGDHAWLDADDGSLGCVDALALWNSRVLTGASAQIVLDRLQRRVLKHSWTVSRPPNPCDAQIYHVYRVPKRAIKIGNEKPG
jgi:hypothetical protein